MLLVFGAMAVLVLFWVFRPRDDRPRSTVAALAAATAFALAGLFAMAPATVRNWRVAHQFVLISSPAGLNVLIGNGPEATGTFVRVMNVEPSVQGQWLDAPAAASRGLLRDASPNETSRYFLRQSLDWIAAHPWQETPPAGAQDALHVERDVHLDQSQLSVLRARLLQPLTLLIVGPTLIVPFGLVGLVVARPADRRGYWLWALYAPSVAPFGRRVLRHGAVSAADADRAPRAGGRGHRVDDRSRPCARVARTRASRRA